MVATASARIGRRYRSESPFDRLVGDVLREETGTEIAFMPGVGYGVSLELGPVTREMLAALLPHPSKLVTLTLTGAQVLEVLEQSATNQRPATPLERAGGLVQTSGLRWTVDLGRPAGSRVREVHVGGAPLDRARAYRVATHDGMLAGIHRYGAFAAGSAIVRREEAVMDIVERALRLRGTVGPPRLGDVTLVQEAR